MVEFITSVPGSPIEPVNIYRSRFLNEPFSGFACGRTTLAGRAERATVNKVTQPALDSLGSIHGNPAV